MVKHLAILVSLLLLTGAARAQVEAAGVTPQDDRLVARENEHWVMEELPLPWTAKVEATCLTEMPDGRVAVATRRGDVFLVSGVDSVPPKLDWHLFATGMHEILGIAQKNGTLYVVQQCEVTRLRDTDADGRCDSYETVSDAWGFGKEHEFTYGGGFDRNGHLWLALCLSGSYTSETLFRGWCLRVTEDGETIPTCSGIRSPGGVGFNLEGDAFYTENQGPWNGACSLKHLRPGGFLGHPISFNWYPYAPNMGRPPRVPKGGRKVRQHDVAREIPELVVPAVVFPYKKMGQSASAIVLDRSEGRFGPFKDQMFVGDYTLSLVMRVDMERVGDTYQGACFPFRQGFATGVLGVLVTKKGTMLAGGCARGWPTRGTTPYSLQRLRWTGKVPFEMREMNIRRGGFELVFTEPVDRELAADPATWALQTYTYRYQKVYGSPEVDHTLPTVTKASVSANGLRVTLDVSGLRIGHVHELGYDKLRTSRGGRPLHSVAYYTLNRLP